MRMFSGGKEWELAKSGSRFHAANCSDHGGSSHTVRTTEGPPTLAVPHRLVLS